MYEAQLKATHDEKISSDWIGGMTQRDAKIGARVNYRLQWDNSESLQQQYPTFTALLLVSEYSVLPIKKAI